MPENGEIESKYPQAEAFETAQGQQASPLTKEQRMEAVLDLSSKFGNTTKIPEEDLTAIGYVRKVMADGAVRLMPYERMVELSQNDPGWEKPLKTRERPFERIAVELPTSEHAFRYIPRAQKSLLFDRLEGVEYAFYPNWNDGTSITGAAEEIDPRIQNLRTFSLDFLDFLTREGINGKILPEDAAATLLFGALPMRKHDDSFEPDDPNDFRHEIFRKAHSEPDGSVTSMEARLMYDELTRLSGYFADVSEVSKDFQSRLDSPFSLTDSHDERTEASLQQQLSAQGKIREVDQKWLDKLQVTKEFQEHLKSIGIQTRADAIRYIFPRYLEHVGLSEMGAVIQKSPHLHAVADTLQYMDTSDNSRAEEKELRTALKTATPEEREALNKRKKELESAKKRKKQLRQGVIDYFASPQVYTDVIRRNVKEAQDFFVAGKGEETGQAEFYLDATPNYKLDQDPGLVSGDCTAGKPLPFDRSDVLAYNVKVFANAERHIGNMYLLVTDTLSDDSEKRKVWHFDAIQIPRTGIDWRESVAMIVATLAKQAEAKGVEAITANNKLHEISNYDYIANAVKEYWDTHGRQMVTVSIPQVGDSEHSPFQGDGDAIVLWSKDKLTEPFEGDLEVNEAFFNVQNEGDGDF